MNKIEQPVVIGYHDLNNQSTHATNNSSQTANNQALTNNTNSSLDQSTPDELNKRLNVNFIYLNFFFHKI